MNDLTHSLTRGAHQYKRIRDAHINNINSRCNDLHIGGLLWLLLRKRVAIGQSEMANWDTRMRRFDKPVDCRRQILFKFCLRTNDRRHRSFSACRENGQMFKHYNSYIHSVICTKVRRKEQLRSSTFLWVASWLQPIFPWGKKLFAP